MKHIILTCLFSLCLALLPAPPARAAEVTGSGTCGATANWFLYDDGTIVIRGTGEIGPSEQLQRQTGKKNVKRIVVEWGITSIAYRTFYGCYASEVILPDSLTNIGGWAFSNSDITELSMPDSVVSVGNGAFANCPYLKKVRLSQNLKILSEAMLRSCSSIQELIIPDSVEEICEEALSGMTYLEKLVIGTGVKSIGKNKIKAISLREIQNHSTLDFSLREFRIETKLVKWNVDGVGTDIVGAGKTAFGKGKEYKLVYKYMDGVTCQGRRPKTYEYGLSVKMPTAKKKGYVFFGWNWTEKRLAKSQSWVQNFDYVPGGWTTGAIVVMPRFLKVSIKKKSRDRFMITADTNGTRCKLFGIGVRYSTDPTMKNCKIIQKDLSGKLKGYKKKFTIKAKKGTTYYIQFVLYDHYDYEEYNYDRCWSKSKVYKME